MNDAPNILVTRAKAQAQPLVDAIGARGWTCTQFPALEIVPFSPGTISERWQALPNADIVVFVSANAVNVAVPAIDLQTSSDIAAIGAQTSAALEALGKTVAITPVDGFDSESLLEHEALKAPLDGKDVVIVRGKGGREHLKTALTQRGAQCHYLEVYERKLAEHDAEHITDVRAALIEGRIDAVTVLSLETYQNLAQLLGSEALTHRPLVTPSQGVLKGLEDNQHGIVVHPADGPDSARLLDGVARALNLSENAQAMTEKDNTDETIDAEAKSPEPEVQTETADAPNEASPAVAPVAKTKRGVAAPLALLLALIALVLSAYNTWNAFNTPATAPAEVVTSEPGPAGVSEDQLDELKQAQEALASRLSDAQDAASARGAELSRLQSQMGARQDIIESMPGRVENLENTISSVQGIAAGTRENWLKAEAEYYMQLANAQLQLARNPSLAAFGLQLADERIRELADPAYTPVRRALAAEIQALAALGNNDQEGAALKLAGLADQVAALPLRSDIVRQRTERDTPSTVDPEASGTSRAWSATKDVLGSMVRVRKIDESVTPLMSPEAAYFLRANLQLKLDAARLSLMRNEQWSYEQNLRQSADWIAQYFDTDNASVRAALSGLAELADDELNSTLPDISESLTLMRQRKNLSEPAAQ
ncbi:MAG: uroporphyrinogen-III C-methyltransferase [Pseudomonadota bacterium]